MILKLHKKLYLYEKILLIATPAYLYLSNLTQIPINLSIIPNLLLVQLKSLLTIYLIAILFQLINKFYPFKTTNYFSSAFLIRTIRRTFSLITCLFFFSNLKSNFLFLNPTIHDSFLWNLDRIIHFGFQPNVEAIKILENNPFVQFLIDKLYFFYFDYLILTILFFLLELKNKSTTDFFISCYCLFWVLGGLSYMILPADGPCYSILIKTTLAKQKAKNNIYPYPIKVSYPKNYPILFEESHFPRAKSIQKDLWNSRINVIENKEPSPFGHGIAAVPSLHVAGVMLSTIFLLANTKIIGLISAVYLLITFFSSIALQWHFAIDGYLGILFTIFIYYSTKYFWQKTPDESTRMT